MNGTPRGSGSLPRPWNGLSAVALAQAYSVSVFATGPVTATLVVMLLTPVGQGFYYTFGSLVAALALFEFGSGAALSQLLGAGKDGPPSARYGLKAVYSAGLLWNRSAVAAFIVVGSVGGSWLLVQSAESGGPVLFPWFGFLVLSAAQGLLAPKFAVLQANQELARYWLNRVAFHWIYSVALWVSLTSGFGLWSLVAAASAGLVWSSAFLAVNRRFLALSGTADSAVIPRWKVFRSRLWPLQWRLGVGWFSVTFALAWLTPIAMFHSGALAAAQMGLTAVLALVIFAFGTNWLGPDEPHFARLVASGDTVEFDREYRARFVKALAATAALAGLAITGIALARWIFPSMVNRVLPPGDSAVLLLGVLTVVAIRNLGTYCRAHCTDPTAVPLAVGSLGALSCAGLLGGRGTIWIASGYCVGMTCIALPFALRGFLALWRVKPEIGGYEAAA